MILCTDKTLKFVCNFYLQFLNYVKIKEVITSEHPCVKLYALIKLILSFGITVKSSHAISDVRTVL
jgi:hypothetical protein